MTSLPLLFLLGASVVSLVSSQGPFPYVPGPFFGGGPMIGPPNGMGIIPGIRINAVPQRIIRNGIGSSSHGRPSHNGGPGRSGRTGMTSSSHEGSGLPGSTNIGLGRQPRRTRGGGFDLGTTEDGQEGYYGPWGGRNGFPYQGGAGSGHQYNDGGIRAGVANGYGPGSRMAFLEKRRLGVNDPFPVRIGPPFATVWSRYSRTLARGSGRRRPTVERSSNRMAPSGAFRRNGHGGGGSVVRPMPRIPGMTLMGAYPFNGPRIFPF